MPAKPAKSGITLTEGVAFTIAMAAAGWLTSTVVTTYRESGATSDAMPDVLKRLGALENAVRECRPSAN
jgi:hypothetical protein